MTRLEESVNKGFCLMISLLNYYDLNLNTYCNSSREGQAGGCTKQCWRYRHGQSQQGTSQKNFVPTEAWIANIVRYRPSSFWTLAARRAT
jgi:hypothetical protein